MVLKVKVFELTWLLAILPFTPTLVEGKYLKRDLNGVFKDQPEETIIFEETENKLDVLPLTKGLDAFGKNMFSELEKDNHKKNIFFSPLSIETCLAMARMGAEGQTAAELDKVLDLSFQNTEQLADSYHTLLAPYQNSSSLQIANKMYIMQGGDKVSKNIEVLLEKDFFSSIDAVNFASSNEAAATINNWVEHKTNNLIKDLVAPGSLNSDTRVVLVNAIHFHAAWETPFPEENTREMDFYLDARNSVKVQMMFNVAKVHLKYIRNLNAFVLELPYADSDFSMVIVLPNSRTGLPQLEENLKGYTLADLTTDMFASVTSIWLPKFKTEFEVELRDSLKNLGLKTMFSNRAEFGKIFGSSDFYVSNFVHKALIEVNEKGTKAAAGTGIISASRTFHNEFRANHPFLYFIKDSKNVVLFRGNVKKF